MSQIGNVPEIVAVKKHLDDLKSRSLVKEWEVPYEHILTRLTAAIFFITPTTDSHLQQIWQELGSYPMLRYSINEDKKLSQLTWRVEFNEKN